MRYVNTSLNWKCNESHRDAGSLQKSGWLIQILAKLTTSFSYLSNIQRQRRAIELAGVRIHWNQTFGLNWVEMFFLSLFIFVFLATVLSSTINQTLGRSAKFELRIASKGVESLHVSICTVTSRKGQNQNIAHVAHKQKDETWTSPGWIGFISFLRRIVVALSCSSLTRRRANGCKRGKDSNECERCCLDVFHRWTFDWQATRVRIEFSFTNVYRWVVWTRDCDACLHKYFLWHDHAAGNNKQVIY